ncbi:hypothetical protein UG55_10146 [Frankia sp. EI5c]|uniref:hypothetical protein n=1 Tax=Frankia sp. EI5c TaxID=683316 RepID=UPI0007C3640B|nr:hypothetical protein [Frankia sp. EI5c]OAA22244.1 hypothetical protein UG55_10512 [Frankia sp. EI5c]OAA26558.1 hypothetical protein UG55_10146 [Frankia sp. EI5c]
MPTNDNEPRTMSLQQALREHLERAERGEGRHYPQPEGEDKFACDMGDSLYGCAWCDNITWPDGNPLDVA